MKYKCLKFFLSPKSGQAGLGGGDDRWPRRPMADGHRYPTPLFYIFIIYFIVCFLYFTVSPYTQKVAKNSLFLYLMCRTDALL